MSQQHKYAETYRIDVGTDAMMRRMQAMVAYNTMRQDGEVSGANLLVKRKYSRKHVERNVDSLDPKKNKDMTYYEYGCSTDGLREDLGVANYHEDQKNREEMQWSNEIHREEDDDDEHRYQLKRSLEEVKIRCHPFLKHEINHRSIRAQMPGWDPFVFAQNLLDVEAEKMVFLRQENTNKKRTRKMMVQTRVCLDLQRPGPVQLSTVDYAKHLAKSEGLTLNEWCKEQDQKVDRQMERDRLKLLEQQRKAQAEASDPRPDFDLLRAGEIAIINARCGSNAVDLAKRRWLRKMTPYRRGRDMATLVSMMALRSQGFGIVHKEQDVVWIETELLMGGERVTEDKDRLLELGVTHILKCQPAYPNQFGEDFIYCRAFVNDKESVRQDVLRVEYAMGLQFAVEALNLGGRVLVTCGAGQESEIPNFKGSYLGRFPLVLADFWTSDHLSERSRSVDAFPGTRARGTLTLKRR